MRSYNDIWSFKHFSLNDDMRTLREFRAPLVLPRGSKDVCRNLMYSSATSAYLPATTLVSRYSYCVHMHKLSSRPFDVACMCFLCILCCSFSGQEHSQPAAPDARKPHSPGHVCMQVCDNVLRVPFCFHGFTIISF